MTKQGERPAVRELADALREGWDGGDAGDRFAESDPRAAALYDEACSGEERAREFMRMLSEAPRDEFLVDLASRMPLDRIDRVTALCGDAFLEEMRALSEGIAADEARLIGAAATLGDVADPEVQRDIMDRSLEAIKKRRPEIRGIGVSDANEIVFYLDGGGEERTPLAASVNPYEALAVVSGIWGGSDEKGEGGDAGVEDGGGPDQEPPAGDQGA